MHGVGCSICGDASGSGPLFWGRLLVLSASDAARQAAALVARIAELRRRGDGVLPTTLHSAKGLEFDHVIIVGLNRQHPADRSAAELTDPEEREALLARERRLLYVAMTRARRRLFLTYSREPSRFIGELDEGLYHFEDRSDGP